MEKLFEKKVNINAVNNVSRSHKVTATTLRVAWVYTDHRNIIKFKNDGTG